MTKQNRQTRSSDPATLSQVQDWFYQSQATLPLARSKCSSNGSWQVQANQAPIDTMALNHLQSDGKQLGRSLLQSGHSNISTDSTWDQQR